jgi:glutaredoxin
MSMSRIPRIFSVAVLLVLAVSAALAQEPAFTQGTRASPGAAVEVHLFWTATCPHCANARRFLERVVPVIPGARLQSLELDGDGRREAAYIALSKRFNNEPPGVPLIIVGDEAFVGYRDDATTGAEIERRIKACLASPCTDVAGPIFAQAAVIAPTAQAVSGEGSPRIMRPELPSTISVPGFGSIETRALSLPMLTIVLGAVDGFNPCAMWVLVLLIGLLVGMNDRVRMWSYGAAFLLTSGAVYFLFMAAWLNLFLFLGSLAWIRAAVGVFALGAGALYLREFVRSPNAACAITTPGERQRVMDRLRSAVSERSFAMAILGIMVLAVAVNMIELLCSAGIPAVYTQVLALSGLTPLGYYAYLALYIAVFMIDDAVIFVAAMLTLQATGLAASYSRWSHLIGGAVLLGVGLLLIFRPAWLAMA